jgi:hypothetical protein
MNKERWDLPDFDCLINTAMNCREVEAPSDLRLIAEAIEICVAYWEQWTDDYADFLQDDKARIEYEDALRGEL